MVLYCNCGRVEGSAFLWRARRAEHKKRSEVPVAKATGIPNLDIESLRTELVLVPVVLSDGRPVLCVRAYRIPSCKTLLFRGQCVWLIRY